MSYSFEFYLQKGLVSTACTNTVWIKCCYITFVTIMRIQFMYNSLLLGICTAEVFSRNTSHPATLKVLCLRDHAQTKNKSLREFPVTPATSCSSLPNLSITHVYKQTSCCCNYVRKPERDAQLELIKAQNQERNL